MRVLNRKFILFLAMIYYFCGVAGLLFLLINGKDLIEYQVSPGPMPLMTFFSFVAAILLTFRYKVMKKRGF